MPFFFILPMWLLAVGIGSVMLFRRATRTAAIYVLTMSTFATLVSFVLSTIVLLAGFWIASALPDWTRFMALSAYAAAIPAGGLLGAIAAFLITRKLLARCRTTSARS